MASAASLSTGSPVHKLDSSAQGSPPPTARRQAPEGTDHIKKTGDKVHSAASSLQIRARPSDRRRTVSQGSVCCTKTTVAVLSVAAAALSFFAYVYRESMPVDLSSFNISSLWGNSTTGL